MSNIVYEADVWIERTRGPHCLAWLPAFSRASSGSARICRGGIPLAPRAACRGGDRWLRS